jgi:hypothetical protein
MNYKKTTYMIPAIPPEDYKGSVADWMIKLQEKGYWDGENPDWYGDVMLTDEEWWKLLEECENE